MLANELREEIVYTISKTGGHLSSSLGVAELTVALHHVFECPKDKIIWDVGHQVIHYSVFSIFFFFMQAPIHSFSYRITSKQLVWLQMVEPPFGISTNYNATCKLQKKKKKSLTRFWLGTRT